MTERGTALDRMRERQERERANAKPVPAKPATADPEGDVFYGGPLVRRNLGQVIRVR